MEIWLWGGCGGSGGGRREGLCCSSVSGPPTKAVQGAGTPQELGGERLPGTSPHHRQVTRAKLTPENSGTRAHKASSELRAALPINKSSGK